MNTKDFSIIKAFARKCQRSTVPILEYLHVKDGILTISDLETWLSIPTKLDDGYYTIINDEFFKATTDYQLDEYPKHPVKEDYDVVRTISLSDGEISPKAFADLKGSVSDDELRPVLTSIFFDKKQIAATNGQVIRRMFLPGSQHHTETMLTPIPQALLSAMRKYKQVDVRKLKPKSGQGHPLINYFFREGDGLEVTVTEIAGEFPNYERIFPERKAISRCISITEQQVKDLVSYSKSIIPESRHIRFSGLKPHISNVDTNIEKTLEDVLETKMPAILSHGLIMPQKCLEETEEEKKNGTYVFGISGKELENISKGHKGNLVLGLQKSNERAITFWLISDTPVTKTPAVTPAAEPKSKPKRSTAKPAKPAAEPVETPVYPKTVIWSNYAA